MSQRCRLPEGGEVDRSRTLSFAFNGRRYEGHPGDTLASALLANGVHLVARSFKYHRPRGIMTAGAEEPNAIVQVGEGARTTPNLKATEVPLYEGLVARSANVFPSVELDLGAAAGLVSRFLPAGFYYKTFFGSPFLWQRVFEPVIRRAGGWGRAPVDPDPDTYERRYHHCDVLVVGAGPAGLAAARAAAAAGARTTLAGARIARDATKARARRIQETRAALSSRDNVLLLENTTVFGYYDSNCLAALERIVPPGAVPPPHTPRERLWHFRAKRVVLATGAHERPLVFANNDRPGILLAGAVSEYIESYGVLPGHRAVLFTNNDGAYRAALHLADAGAEVAAVIDSRPAANGPLPESVRARGIPVRAGHVVVDTGGHKRIARVAVGKRVTGKALRAGWLACDLLAVSGGWSPVVHLHSQAQGGLAYDEAHACFRPAATRAGNVSVGACNGTFGLRDALAEAQDAGRAAAEACGFEPGEPPVLPDLDDIPATPPSPLWLVPVNEPVGIDRSHQKGKRLAKDFEVGTNA